MKSNYIHGVNRLGVMGWYLSIYSGGWYKLFLGYLMTFCVVQSSAGLTLCFVTYVNSILGISVK
jgi:hypothetical protein